jgi:proton glutamate symport protein
MKYAPIGIGAAMAVTVSHSGLGVLGNLAKLILTLYGALIVFALVALLPAALIARVPIRRFIRAVKDPALIAFTTTSSDAALPLAMERMVQFGVPRRIVAFVMPTGYSFNLDGSTLYLGVASLFVAQAAGIEMTLPTQLGMMLTLLITSKGIAAVPRASLVVLSGVLSTYGLPLEGVAVISWTWRARW